MTCFPVKKKKTKTWPERTQHDKQLRLVAWEEVRYESNSLQASQLQALLLPWVSVAGKNAVIFTIKNYYLIVKCFYY